jgi:uncharacterized Zn finger protein (UPF0148 family)
MKFNLAVAAALGGVAILVAFFYQSAAFTSRAGEDTPLYSVRRHDPYGTAALRDLLAERGTPVRTLERPDLEPTDHGVLIQTFSAEVDQRRHGVAVGDSTKRQTDALLEWISEGNTVLEFTRVPTALMNREKAPSTPTPPDISGIQKFERSGGPPAETPAAVVAADTEHADSFRLLLWSPMTFADPTTRNWRILARTNDENRKIVAVESRIGKGKLIVVGAPTPALNGMIGDEQNLDFLLSVIGNQPVIFDEWLHGIGHEQTIVSFLGGVGLLPMLVQIVFVVALYVWGTSGFSAPVEEKVVRQRSSAEQIETLGYLYSRSLNHAITFDRVEKEVQRRLAEALRCQPRDLAGRLEKIKLELREEIQQMFARLGALRAGQGVHCPSCGYDLSFNKSGNCPECGSAISAPARLKIAETQPETEIRAQASATAPAPSKARRRRTKGMQTALAEVLSASHELTREVNRDRRGRR